MWQLNGAMSSPRDAANGRPWTPPDTDSDYFSGSFRPRATEDDIFEGIGSHQPYSPHTRTSFAKMSERPKPPSRKTEPSYPVNARGEEEADIHNPIPRHSSAVDSHTLANSSDITYEPSRRSTLPVPPSLRDSGFVGDELDEPAHDTLPEHADNVDPHTPVKQITTPEPQIQDGMPRYPYTPDSARVPSRRLPLPPLSPLPSMPWDNSSSSPVQNALSSCITHLEDLIQTRQPNDAQMEYIVTKFEEMAQYLSAPEAQSRQSDDHLFSELSEIPSGLGIISQELLAHGNQNKKSMKGAVEYILEVGKYIEDVSRHTEDLKTRFDEAKQLNSIQLEIIAELRRLVKNPQKTIASDNKDSKEGQDTEQVAQEMGKKDNLRRGPYLTMGFWPAIGEALDKIGEMLHEC